MASSGDYGQLDKARMKRPDLFSAECYPAEFLNKLVFGDSDASRDTLAYLFKAGVPYPSPLPAALDYSEWKREIAALSLFYGITTPDKQSEFETESEYAERSAAWIKIAQAAFSTELVAPAKLTLGKYCAEGGYFDMGIDLPLLHDEEMAGSVRVSDLGQTEIRYYIDRKRAPLFKEKGFEAWQASATITADSPCNYGLRELRVRDAAGKVDDGLWAYSVKNARTESGGTVIVVHNLIPERTFDFSGKDVSGYETRFPITSDGPYALIGKGSARGASSVFWKSELTARYKERVTVGLLTDATGIDDMSFNAAAWRGILAFYGDTMEKPSHKGELYYLMTASTQDMYIPNLDRASDGKTSLIIATGFTFADALDEAAKKYPEQKYMIVDVDYVPHPNVMQITFAEEEGAFLVGAAAALKAQAAGVESPKFGFIGGMAGPIITKFEMGYIQGIRYILPEAEILDYYANDWGRPELAKAQAKNWYDSGVYAIFSAAGGTGNGTIAQAKEYRSQGKDVWAIGVDSDQYEDGLYADGESAVLTSMIKRVENAAKYALKQVEAGTFKAETVVLDCKADGVGFSDTNKELGADIVAKVNEIKARLSSGEIKVLSTYAEARAAGLVSPGLGASDE